MTSAWPADLTYLGDVVGDGDDPIAPGHHAIVVATPLGWVR
jgi:hypothetical protein